MPLTKGKSYEDCVSKNIKIEMQHGKSQAQAVAIAKSHCGKLWGKDKKTKHELIEEMKKLIEKGKKL